MSSILTGAILDGGTAFSMMSKIVPNVVDADVWIISAFLKSTALSELLEGIHQSNRVKILVRWQPDDLLSGASDLSSYQIAKNNQWQFYAMQNLHAKAFMFDGHGIFVGSANLTTRGFSLQGLCGNAETMVSVDASIENKNALRSMMGGATELNDQLVRLIGDWLLTFAANADGLPENAITIPWPLKKDRYQRVTSLLVSECFLTKAEWLNSAGHDTALDKHTVRHDLSLLGASKISQDFGKNLPRDLTNLLCETKIFSWLNAVVLAEPNQEIYFGRLTALLQDALLDDPRPYRSDIKTLVQNLIGWIREMPECGLHVDRPNYSERIHASN